MGSTAEGSKVGARAGRWMDGWDEQMGGRMDEQAGRLSNRRMEFHG